MKSRNKLKVAPKNTKKLEELSMRFSRWVLTERRKKKYKESLYLNRKIKAVKGNHSAPDVHQPVGGFKKVV